MATLKSFLLLAALGFITGILVTMAAAPAFLAWYNTPGGAGQAMCNCMDLVRATSDSLVQWELIGGGVGAVAFLAAGLFWPRRAPKVKTTPAPQPPAAQPPAVSS